MCSVPPIPWLLSPHVGREETEVLQLHSPMSSLSSWWRDRCNDDPCSQPCLREGKRCLQRHTAVRSEAVLSACTLVLLFSTVSPKQSKHLPDGVTTYNAPPLCTARSGDVSIPSMQTTSTPLSCSGTHNRAQLRAKGSVAAGIWDPSLVHLTNINWVLTVSQDTS